MSVSQRSLRCIAICAAMALLVLGWPVVGQQKNRTGAPTQADQGKVLQPEVARLRHLLREQLFRTVDQEHWCYQAYTTLQQKGILLDYPESYFTGKKRLLSRCEFALAIFRTQVRLHPEAYPSPKGPASGHADPPLSRPLDPQMQRLIERLEAEFHTELVLLKNENVGAW